MAALEPGPTQVRPGGGQPEVDRYEPETLEGWIVLVVGSAHHVDTETERASITSARADPWPELTVPPTGNTGEERARRYVARRSGTGGGRAAGQ